MWVLAAGNSYRTTNKTFVVDKSISVAIVQKFYMELKTNAHNFIRFPSAIRDTTNVNKKFKEFRRCKTPQVISAVHYTHNGISTAHNDSKTDYFCLRQLLGQT